MKIAIALISSLLCLLSLPAVIELLLFLVANLFMRFDKRKERMAVEGVKIDALAILVPAHDEEKCIARCVMSLLASDYGKFVRDVIVIADNCRDRTAQIAREAGARVIERFDDSRRGKGAALDYAITLLGNDSYDAYVIVDADSVVSSDFVRVLGEQFEQGKEAVQCINLPLNVEASPRIRLVNLAMLSMNVFRPMGREALGYSVGILGNGFGLTKSLLDKVPYSANSIAEDLEYHLELIEAGHKVRFVPQARVLSDFPVSKEGAETQRARWEGGRFLLQRTVAPRLMGKILRGRLSFVEPFLELMSLPLSYETVLLLILAFLPFQPFSPYGFAGLVIIFLQIVVAVLLYGTKRDFLSIAQIPFYLGWKLIKLPHILMTSRKGAQWVRTKRD